MNYAKDARDFLALVRATIEQRKQINADLAELASREMCGRCARKAAFCVCGLWDHAPMSEAEHNRYPSGRYSL